MKSCMLLLATAVILSSVTVSAQLTISRLPGENLYDYQARMEAYFAPQIASRGLDALLGEEGGEYNEYLKFMRFWEPRLYPSGDFASYYQREYNFYHLYNQPRRRAVSHVSDAGEASTVANTVPWQEIGPIGTPAGGHKFTRDTSGNGPIEFLLFYNSDPQHMLCGSTVGGLFYSSNGGASWSKTGTDSLIGGPGISAAALDPTDYKTWFAASSGNSHQNNAWAIGLTGGVFRTKDEGVTWSQIASSSDLGGIDTRINKIESDPQNHDRLWVATSSGLYVNDAHCHTEGKWTAVIPNKLVYDIELRPEDSNWVYATVREGTEGPWHFLYSSDSGCTWTDVPQLPSTTGVQELTIEVTRAKPTYLYCLYGRSANTCANNDGNVAGTSALYIYDFCGGAPVQVTADLCVFMGDGNAFGVSPTNPNEIFVGHDTEGRRYTYAGTATTHVQYASAYTTGGTYHPDIEALVPHPKNLNEVWMCHHGGISVSTDDGATWSDRSAGLGVAQVLGMADASSDPGYVAVGTYHDGTAVTAPPWFESWSPRWTHVLPGDGMRPMIAPTSPQYMWGSFAGRTNDPWYRSANYGADGSFAQNGPTSSTWTIAAAVFNHLLPSTQYRMATDQTIRRTTDWGVTWPAAPISDFHTMYQSFTLKKLYSPPTNGDTLLVEINANGQDLLYRTKQANAAPEASVSWEELALPPYPRVGDIEFDPSNLDILYFANASSSPNPPDIIGKDLVIRGDYTDPKDLKHPIFTDLTQNLPFAAAGDDALAITNDGTGGLYYACDFGVFYSNEATRATGQGWTPFGTALPNTTYTGVEINNVNHKVRVASFGRGVWEHDLAATISGMVFQDLNHNGTLDAGEPPLTGWTVTLTSAAGVVVSAVTDATGRYTFSALAAGGYQVDQSVPAGWAQTAPSGKYSFQLAAGQWLKGQDFGNDRIMGITCAPPPADMTGWWAFNESANSTTAHDAAGFDNAGTRVGNPQLVNGKVASAFHFDGSTQYIQVATHPEIDVDAGNFSIHAWVRTSRSGFVPIVDKRANPVLGYSFFLLDGRLGIQMADRQGSPSCSPDNTVSACTNWLAPVGSSSVADGQWHHVAVAIDRHNPAGGVLYLDGMPVLHFDPTIRAQSLGNAAPLLIGRNSQGSLWQGEIDEVSLFKRALSPYDIAAVYKAGTLGQCLCTSNCPVDRLQGGKVVFVSDRVTPPQLFVQQVSSHAAPLQLTTDFFGARHPKWSPDGNYVAYVRGDVAVGNGGSDDELAVMEEANPSNVPASIHASKFNAQNLGYPQWSDDGKSIVVLFFHASGLHGLGLIQFPFLPFFSSPTVTTLLDGDASLNPGEPVFSHDGKTVYFAADTPSTSAALFKIPVTGGVPTPVLDQYGTQVHLLYAPSMSPDGKRLMFNSEMWREQPAVYQDEEILELELSTGVVKRITAEPGNQYGWFVKNGQGEFLLQSNNTASGKYALYLQANGVRIPFDVGAPQNQNQSGDWWKSP